MHQLEASCMCNVFLSSSSSQQPTIIQNVLHGSCLLASLTLVSHITKQAMVSIFITFNSEVIDINLQIVASSKKDVGLYCLKNSNKSLRSSKFNLPQSSWSKLCLGSSRRSLVMACSLGHLNYGSSKYVIIPNGTWTSHFKMHVL